MAEFTKNEVQVVQVNQPVILDTTIGCSKGYVLHRNESGIVTLRGLVNNACNCFARYQVTFNGNIGLTEGATVGPVSIALAISGEPVLTSKAIVTPAAVTEANSDDNYFNVTSTAIVTVPKGCCFNISVENTSTGTTPPAINVKNANLTVTRIA